MLFVSRKKKTASSGDLHAFTSETHDQCRALAVMTTWLAAILGVCLIDLFRINHCFFLCGILLLVLIRVAVKALEVLFITVAFTF